LTTVYPTDTTGGHGNSGGKSAGKDVFPSGKGRKCLETSGNRYSCNVWDHQAAGSSPVTLTKNADLTAVLQSNRLKINMSPEAVYRSTVMPD